MGLESGTRLTRTFDEWLDDCSQWWDMSRGDEVADFPWLDWRAWYEEGLTVEAAVERADREVYGS